MNVRERVDDATTGLSVTASYSDRDSAEAAARALRGRIDQNSRVSIVRLVDTGSGADTGNQAVAATPSPYRPRMISTLLGAGFGMTAMAITQELLVNVRPGYPVLLPTAGLLVGLVLGRSVYAVWTADWLWQGPARAPVESWQLRVQVHSEPDRQRSVSTLSTADRPLDHGSVSDSASALARTRNIDPVGFHDGQHNR
ncbi:MAG: hypothetical protein KDK91_14710 [Gammaproteobacteria bacterium]|nr:hypothetical protein [Gammaproteobacteria bacterium]